MPNVKSAKKRLKQAEKANSVNKAVKSAIRNSLKKVKTSQEKEVVLTEVPKLHKLIDKAARKLKGGMNKSKAANYKRQISKAVSSLSA